MTEDITGLIAELRDESSRVKALILHAGIEYNGDPYTRAADALEAQAQRITELEAALEAERAGVEGSLADTMRSAFYSASVERDALAAQIAEALAFANGIGEDRWLRGVKRILSAPASDALNRVRAETLREAAAAMRRHKDPGHWNLRDEDFPADAAQSPDSWLERRADRIEASPDTTDRSES